MPGSFNCRRPGILIVADQMLMIIPDNEVFSATHQFLLCWSIKGRDWKAVNFEHVNAKSFAENERDSTEVLKSLLAVLPHLSKRIINEGVFLDEKNGIYAFEFYKSAKKYQIRALP